MTTAWSIFKMFLPYLLNVLGAWMAAQGHANQKDPNFSKQPSVTASVYGGGQKVAGIVLFGAGMAGHAMQSHKLAAGAPISTPLSPVQPNASDPATEPLIAAKQKIHDAWTKKAAADAAEATRQIAEIDKLLAARKGSH